MLIIATVVLMIASQVAASYPTLKNDFQGRDSNFQAQLTSDGNYTGVSQFIRYDVDIVTLRYDYAYNNDTGRFVCPTTGLYSFTVEAFLHEDSPVNAEISIIHGVRRNDTVKGVMVETVVETAVLKVWLRYVSQTQTRSTYIELTKGDEVYVKPTSSARFQLKGGYPGGYNQFSGRQMPYVLTSLDKKRLEC